MVVDSPWSVRQAFVQAPFHCEYSTDFGADSRKGALYLAPVEIPMWFTVLGICVFIILFLRNCLDNLSKDWKSISES